MRVWQFFSTGGKEFQVFGAITEKCTEALKLQSSIFIIQISQTNNKLKNAVCFLGTILHATPHYMQSCVHRTVCATFKGGVSLLQAENINLCESYGKYAIIPTTNSPERIRTSNRLYVELYRPLGILATN